jgi:hypothetical protein
VVREAAGQIARKRIEEQYQWQRIAEDIENVYLEMLGRKSAEPAVKKPSLRADAAEEKVTTQLRAG